jgi:signal transduction histidine kinase
MWSEMIDLVILVVCNVANLVLGLSIYLRNPHTLSNRIFAFLSLAIILWTSFNYAADNVPADLTLLFSRLTFLGGPLMGIGILYLSRYFPNDKLLKHSAVNNLQLPLAICTALLSLSPWVIESATPAAHGAELSTGPLYAVYLFYMIQGVAVLIYNFRVQIKKAYLAIQKNQVQLITIGLLVYVFFAIGSNLVLPLIVDTWTSSRFGPVASLFLVAIIGYTIVRHKLFDLKLAIARSITYLASLAIFAFAYGILVFSLVNFVFNIDLPIAPQIVLALVTGVAALSFYRLKRFFDRFTGKLFFRDAYDPQDFFNAFNKILVSSADLKSLLGSTTDVFSEYIKSKSVLVYIRGSDKNYYVGDNAFATVITKAIEEDILELTKTVTLVDELIANNVKIGRVLAKNDIVIVVRLGAVYRDSKEDLGYMLLGSKKSGNLYNKQDINVLEAAANELVIAVQNALRFEEIRQFNKTLQEKIDDATKELRKTNEQLQKLDTAKDEFVSMASHQLRTPLTSVKGYISMVLEGDVGKITPMQRQMLSEAFTSSERMVHLIGDFLNVSRLQTGKFILETKPVDLAKLVAQEIDSLQTTIEAHGLKLNYRKPSYFPVLMLDEGKIRQVLMNFIDNAIFYSPEGKTITVKLSVEEGFAVARVIDAGIGVPKSEQAHLFTKFFRASNARKQRPDGTGVGLFLAKKVIAAHGGTILFESEEGKGSTFGFRLPIKKLQTSKKEAKTSSGNSAYQLKK